jgi:L-ribulokinase
LSPWSAEFPKQKPGETGLLALDWNNGNRTILVDVRLTGLILGQTLHTQAHEIYRALIEATAFGALTIIKRMEEYGVAVDEVVNTGGLGEKRHPHADLRRHHRPPAQSSAASDQTCALGAALFGAAASGQIGLAEAQANVCRMRERVYHPIPEHQAIYARLYAHYRTLHDAFGTAGGSGQLHHVMKCRSHRLLCRCRPGRRAGWPGRKSPRHRSQQVHHRRSARGIRE